MAQHPAQHDSPAQGKTPPEPSKQDEPSGVVPLGSNMPGVQPPSVIGTSYDPDKTQPPEGHATGRAEKK